MKRSGEERRGEKRREEKRGPDACLRRLVFFCELSTSGSAGDHLARGGRGPSHHEKKQSKTKKRSPPPTPQPLTTITNGGWRWPSPASPPTPGGAGGHQMGGGRGPPSTHRSADQWGGHSPQRVGAKRRLPEEVYYDRGRDPRRASVARHRLSGVSSRRAGAARHRLSGTDVTKGTLAILRVGRGLGNQRFSGAMGAGTPPGSKLDPKATHGQSSWGASEGGGAPPPWPS